MMNEIKQPIKRKQNQSDSDSEDELELLNESAGFCDNKIEKNTDVFLQKLKESNNETC